MERGYLECNCRTIDLGNRQIMVYLRLRSIVGLAPLIESIVAGLSDHTLSLKSLNGSSSSSGLSLTSANFPSSSQSASPHPSETAALNNQVANLTDGPGFQCLSKYGVTLLTHHCNEALESIPEDSHLWVFGRRTRPNVQFGLPFRFLSGTLSAGILLGASFLRSSTYHDRVSVCSYCAVDGTCAIDISMSSSGGADADIGSWAQIRDAAKHIIEDCVEGAAGRYAGLGGINRNLGMSRDFSCRSYHTSFSNMGYRGLRSEVLSCLKMSVIDELNRPLPKDSRDREVL